MTSSWVESKKSDFSHNIASAWAWGRAAEKMKNTRKKKTNGASEMTWFWISKGKLNYCMSKVCGSCWFFSRWLFLLKFLEEEANNWIEETVYRLVMWEAERGNTVLYTIHIRAKNNGVQARHRRIGDTWIDVEV